MSDLENAGYFLRRERGELAMASAAKGVEARRAHLKLAFEYRRQALELGAMLDPDDSGTLYVG